MNCVAIVLAAGAASRFGSDKLSAQFKGEPVIAHAIRAASAAPVSRVIVVCSPALGIGSWPSAPPIEALRISSPELSASLKAGIAAAADAAAAIIFLGDMPLIPPGLASELAAAIADNFAVVPRYRGQNAHPVLLAAKAFPEIARLTGDQGAGRLFATRKDIAFVDCADEGVILDIDRAEDIARLEVRRG